MSTTLCNRVAPAEPSRNLGRGQRFGLWVGGVALTLGSPLLPLVVPSPNPALAADAIALFGLGLMVILLASTPADAIRLPRWLSWLMIALGTAWMVGMRLAQPGMSNMSGTVANTITGALMIGLIYTAIVLLAIAIAWGLRQVRSMVHAAPRHTEDQATVPSPWRVVLYAWHPALPLFAATGPGLYSQPRIMVLGVIAAVAILVVAIASDEAMRSGPRLPRALGLFVVSAIMILIIRLLE